MKTTNTSVLLQRCELGKVDVERPIVNRKLELLGRKPWSTCEGSGIIDWNQEMIIVKWGTDTN